MAHVSPRPRWHVTAPAGRLNDPNGLFLSGDTLHVFYQHDPVFPREPKRTGWGHCTIDLAGELIPRHLPDALYPGEPYDLHGCYSGSAVRDDAGRLRFYYTGNLKSDGQRFATQNQVFVDDPDGPLGGTYTRDPENPRINAPAPGFTAHYRDPQITRTADGWRMVLGAQTVDGRGAVVLYTSPDLDNWDFAGALEFSADMPDGYMWECPNLLRIDDHDVLVFCPQAETDDCGYVVGHLDGTSFEVTTPYTRLDHGYEFYAPQLISHGDGALMLGWMGLPGRDETFADGWVHSLTVPRQVSLIDGRLHQRLLIPDEMPQWREELGEQDTDFELVDSTGNVGLRVRWRASRSELLLDRDGDVRVAPCGPGELHLIADGNAIELTCGDTAAASIIFPSPGATWASFKRK